MSFNKLERHASHKWHITPDTMTNSDDADREKSMYLHSCNHEAFKSYESKTNMGEN